MLALAIAISPFDVAAQPSDTATYGDTHDSVPRGPYFELLPVESYSTWRSAYPRMRLEGSLWSGKGAATLLRGGLAVRFNVLSVRVEPEAVAWQNAPHPIAVVPEAAGSEWMYPWAFGEIDLPQRPGPDGAFRLGPGRSSLAVHVGPVDLEMSTRSLGVDDGRAYSLLYGPGAPGFPHVSATVVLDRPRFGRTSVRLVSGRLKESDYFDSQPSNDLSYLSMVDVKVRPAVAAGLEMALGLSVRGRWQARSIGQRLVRSLVAPWSENDQLEPEDISVLVSAQWDASSGTRVWGEWLRSDFFLNLEDLLSEPEHSQAVSLGLRHSWSRERITWVARTEYASTAASNPAQGVRGADFATNSTVYRHSALRQGHTHQGRILGLALGPGSSGVIASVNRMVDGASVGVELERVFFDLDVYDLQIRDAFPDALPDREYTVSLHGNRSVAWGHGAIELGSTVGVSHRRNRAFVPFSTGDTDPMVETNLWMDVRLTWYPRRGAPGPAR